MNEATALVSLWAETSIHAGASSTTGVIDLPIQREGHTGWPCIFGSAVKGAMRAKAEAIGLGALDVIFGPSPNASAGSEYAGALAVGDARLLLLPVRALTGHFKWVTCPALLQRLQRDTQRLGISINLIDGDLSTLTPNSEDTALLPASTNARSIDQYLFLEEYRFQTQQVDLSKLIETLTRILGIVDTAANNPLTKQLCIVTDERFAFFAQQATPVAPHIAIDNPTKTVRPGALWYEETLPPETILYTTLHAWPARKNGASMAAKDILAAVLPATDPSKPASQLFPTPYLQLGGNETVGMGWCRLHVITSK